MKEFLKCPKIGVAPNNIHKKSIDKPVELKTKCPDKSDIPLYVKNLQYFPIRHTTVSPKVISFIN